MKTVENTFKTLQKGKIKVSLISYMIETGSPVPKEERVVSVNFVASTNKKIVEETRQKYMMWNKEKGKLKSVVEIKNVTTKLKNLENDILATIRPEKVGAK